MPKAHWHTQPVPEILAALDTSPHGLSAAEAARRLAADGPNELRRGETISPIWIFLGQFSSLVVWVLLGAAVVSAAVGELADGIAIFAIVVLNAVIGFFQEYRAEQAVAALSRMTAPRAKVIRDGEVAVVPAREIVRGDLIAVEAGDLVAADARLLDASMLRTNEAPLTGESEPVGKRTSDLAPEAPLAERSNMVFLGTSVASGTGR